jgi:hypothetical protein
MQIEKLDCPKEKYWDKISQLGIFFLSQIPEIIPPSWDIS